MIAIETAEWRTVINTYTVPLIEWWRALHYGETPDILSQNSWRHTQKSFLQARSLRGSTARIFSDRARSIDRPVRQWVSETGLQLWSWVLDISLVRTSQTGTSRHGAVFSSQLWILPGLYEIKFIRHKSLIWRPAVRTKITFLFLKSSSNQNKSIYCIPDLRLFSLELF